MLFFMWQHLLSVGTGLAGAYASARDSLWPTLKANWVYWSAVHVLSFSVVPLNYRVAFVSIKNVTWGAFLSWVAARAAERPAHPAASN